MIRIRAIPAKAVKCIGDHRIEKAADIFALRPPGKKLNAYELTSPGASQNSRSGGSQRI
jgi:hypothetical protein